jgi:hypothetical protein
MPQPAGNPLCPQSGIYGKCFIVVGVTLDVSGVQRVQRITQTGYIVENASNAVGY